MKPLITVYAWHQQSPDGPAIHLAHDFQQVETLPENDRTRYTIVSVTDGTVWKEWQKCENLP